MDDLKSSIGNYRSNPVCNDEESANRWLDRQLSNGRKRMFTVTVELTPALASALLAGNKSNRNISSRINEYVRDISNGAWDHNGETMIVSSDGLLNDGQHRCLAVVYAERSIITQITFGASRESRLTVDTGIKRTPGVILNLDNHPDYNVLAHAVNLIITFNRYGEVYSKAQNRATTSEVKAWLKEHPDMAAHLTAGRGVYRSFHVSIGLCAALHYIFSQTNPVSANNFFDSLSSGEMLKKGDPIYQLRDFLTRNAASKNKLTYTQIAAYIIKAWNMYCGGSRKGTLSWRSKKNPNEDFPKVYLKEQF